MKILKQEKKIELDVFGVTVGVYNSFEGLYRFALQAKDTAEQALARAKRDFQDDEYVEELKQIFEITKLGSVQNSRVITQSAVEDVRNLSAVRANND